MEDIYTPSDFDEYYLDFHDSMREEEQKLTQHNRHSPQLDSRPKLIEFAKTLCRDRLLSRTTLHLACYIIDRFMDLFEIGEERLRMFCAVCVLIAAKFEDRGECIPRWAELLALFGTEIDSHEYTIFECMILNSMHWKLTIPTAASFLEYYIVASVTPQDVPVLLKLRQQKLQIFPELKLKMYNVIFYLLDLSLDRVDMIGVRPSKLAAAAILAGRQLLGYRPHWTKELQILTEYQIQDIFAVAQQLGMLYEEADELHCDQRISGAEKREFSGDDLVGVSFSKRFRESR